MSQYDISPRSLASKITPSDRIAFITSHRLGDTLLGMIVVNNLRREGYTVEVFSQVVFGLKEWFPGVTVFPFSEFKNRASTYQHIWFERPNRWIDKAAFPQAKSNVILKGSPLYRMALPMSTILQLICQYELGISHPVLENGLVIPESAQVIKDPKKIIIHPTSSSWIKNWKIKGFIQVGRLLQDQGFNPEFILAPQDIKVALRLREAGMNCFTHSDLVAVARHLGIASWFIGNDSGLGQLASNVGTPTITLFTLPRRVMRWQPCWAPAIAVLPTLPQTIPELLRHIIWKHWITPEEVLAAFQHFRKTELKSWKSQGISDVL